MLGTWQSITQLDNESLGFWYEFTDLGILDLGRDNHAIFCSFLEFKGVIPYKAMMETKCLTPYQNL